MERSIDKYIETIKAGKLLKVDEIIHLSDLAKDIFDREGNAAEVRAPVTVVGDIHG
jgi:hypothetical protein